MRSIKRLSRCAESDNFEELPKSADGLGLAWLAIGFEPSSCMGDRCPQVVEILAREVGESQAAEQQKLNAEKLNAEKLNAEKLNAAEQSQAAERKLNVEQSQAAEQKQNAESQAAEQKQNAEKLIAEQSRAAEQKQNAVPDSSTGASTPSKRKKSRLPKVTDFLPQFPGALGKVDPSDL